MLDTLLAGWTGVTAAYLVAGEAPALVDTGARTSAATVRDALAAAGVGPDDLRWIVLTHVHLDHCGATGLLAECVPAGPRGRPRPRRPPPGRAGPARRRHRGRARRALSPCTAGSTRPRPSASTRRRTATSSTSAAAGGCGWSPRRATPATTWPCWTRRAARSSPATPSGCASAAPARIRRCRRRRSTRPPGWPASTALEALRPAVLCPAHFGPVPDPEAAIADARRQLALAAEAAVAAPDRDALAAELERRIPMAASMGDPGVGRVARPARAGHPQTVDGLWAWAERAREGYCLRHEERPGRSGGHRGAGAPRRGAPRAPARQRVGAARHDGPGRHHAGGGGAGRPGRADRRGRRRRSSSSTPSTATRGRGWRSPGSGWWPRGATP